MSEQNADTPGQPKSPWQEITQPFIDLLHAPRALWGINLAYVIEGMVYFGMLGYLSIYFSDYVFQAIDGANEAAHYMVMVLTAGITIAMFFLGIVADKRGVRFALIAAFLCMLVGRAIWSGGPNLFGLQPVRPGVFVGDKVSLRVGKLETRQGVKTITEAEVFANDEGGADVDGIFKLDLAAGDGTAPTQALESRLVQLSRAQVVSGKDEEWTVRYGSKPVEAKLFLHSASELSLHSGDTISLSRAYVTRMMTAEQETEEKEKAASKEPTLGKGAVISLNRATVIKEDEDGTGFAIEVRWPEDVASVDTSACKEPETEYLIRSHWLSEVDAIDTFPLDLAQGDGTVPDATLESFRAQLSEAKLVEGEGREWTVEYGGKPVQARLRIKDEERGAVKIESVPDLSLGDGRAPDAELAGQRVQVGKAELIQCEGENWRIRYGRGPVTARLLVGSAKHAALAPGALISLRRADVVESPQGEAGFVLRARWPDDFAAVDTFQCEESPYRTIVTPDEKLLKNDSRNPVVEQSSAIQDARGVTIAELREMEDGQVNVALKDVYVTYVRNGGYMVQAAENGPAVSVFVSPFRSSLQIVTVVGILLVVIGYGMYQPAAYAGVRKFTTPKTAAMGFAMLYALMNLGGWFPTFAFLLRDDDYLGLGIPGTFWVYTGFTVLALLVTVVILNKRTVTKAEATAKAETARIKAEEPGGQQDTPPEAKNGEETRPSDADFPERPPIKSHMWLLWIGAMVLVLFKGESPWYHTWEDALWRWYIAGAIFVSPVFIATVPRLRNWIAIHPLQNGKFAFFIFALIPVQTLFTYNWLVLPPYINRAFEGWIGDKFEIAANANPLLIFIAVPIITALTQKAKVYNMMIYGTFIMAAPAFLLVIGPHWYTLAAYLLIMTIGEAMWQPRFLQYAAEIAPEGRTGEYMGVAQFPWFLTKVLVPLLYSGRMMDRYCPAEGVRSTEFMWFIFGCIAITSTLLLILAKGWVGKDFKTKAD
ncbi:MAG TPA: MFS transporter [Phycisphaerae bacterium]|nr:MFS transporter [Phycisphaerae bacterium]